MKKLYTAALVASLLSAGSAGAAKFSLGDRVQALTDLNVRATPSAAGVKAQTQPTGAVGIVVDGPTTAADGTVWWNINYDSGVDGWCNETKVDVVMPPDSTVSTISNGDTVTGMSGSRGYRKFYQMAVPTDAADLTFTTSSGTGDVDIYAKFGSQPTTSSYDAKSDGVGPAESIVIPTPQVGTYYLLVNGYSSYSGVSMSASHRISDRTAPSVPASLAGSATSPTQTFLTWAASTDNVGVTGYKVYRAGTQVGTSTSTSYADSQLSPYTSYSYTVAAYDAAGNTSAQSSPVSVKTQRDAFSTISAISADQNQGVTINTASPAHVGSFDNTDWVKYANVQFGTAGAQGVTINLTVDAAHAGQSIEVHLDSPTGTKVGSLTPTSTGDWFTYQDQSAPITATTGLHDVYLVGVGTTAVADVGSLKFTASAPPRNAFSTISAVTADQYQGVTIVTTSPTHVGSFDAGDWVKYANVNFGTTGAVSFTANVAVGATSAGQGLEIRLDGVTGTKIGTLVPTATGSWTAYQNESTTVTSTTGVHDVYLVAIGTTAIADVGSFSFSTSAPPTTLNNIDTIVNDMKLASDANGIGQVNAWGPTVVQGNDPCTEPSWWPGNHNLGCWDKTMPWLAIFPASNPNNTSTTARIQVKNLKVYYFSKASNSWVFITGGVGVTGSQWSADFSTVTANPGDYRVESDGSVSVIPTNGNLWHGWVYPPTKTNSAGPNGTFLASDIGGMFATVQARLIPNTVGGTIPSGARYIINVGADYYPPDGSNLGASYYPGVGGSRYKLLPTSGAWVPISMHTMTEAQIRANPPPME